jgi:sec-independent protein translocase protein TatA
MMLAGLGWTEMALIAVVALLIFGRRLPEVGRSLGQTLVEFKKGLRGVDDDVKDVVNEAKGAATQAKDAARLDKP